MPASATRRQTRQVSGDDVIIEAAWLYYHDDLNQNEIAERLGVSRATVVNYLQDAREKGFVQITLSAQAFSGHRLALALKERFGLDGALIVPDNRLDPPDTANRVARAAAQGLPSMLEAGDRLGVAWGKTIDDLAECIDAAPIADLTILQLVGSMATPYGFSADVCSSYVARKFSARCINLHVPAILSTPEIAETLRREHLIASQLDEIGRFNKTLFAVGSCLPDSHVASSGVATQKELQDYIANGAVGVLCGRFIDASGNPVSGPLDDRMMGIELDMLRHRDMGILVSIGEDRVPAAVAALKGGYATHVVTNQSCAAAMMELA